MADERNSLQAAENAPGGAASWLTLDVWAVLLSFVLALLVWSGVLKNIPW